MYKVHTKEKSLRVIFYYTVYCILSEALGYYFHEIRSAKNFLVLLSLFTVVEFSAFCLFYYYTVPEGILKKIVLPIGGLFLLFASIDFFLVNQMNSFDSIAVGVESILVILMCIYYLTTEIKGSTNPAKGNPSLLIFSTSNFWIIITFLIYLSGSFFLYIMAETMWNDRDFRNLYNIINSVFYVLKNILLSIAMVMKSSPDIKKKILTNNNDWDDLLSYKLKN